MPKFNFPTNKACCNNTLSFLTQEMETNRNLFPWGASLPGKSLPVRKSVFRENVPNPPPDFTTD